MTRIAAALLLWVIVLGGLNLYMKRFETSGSDAASSSRQRLAQVEAPYAMELTTTFSVESDPFALTAGVSKEPAGLVVQLQGHEVLRKGGEVEAGAPIVLNPVPGLVRGLNEFFVEANMPLDSIGRSYALRFRLMQAGSPVAEETFWSEGENRITGVLRVSLENDKENGGPHHEH
jgi:hypothetical protein